MQVSRYYCAIACFAAGCAATAPPPAQLANPASRHCVEAGGKLVIERTEAGEIGVCVFEDNRQGGRYTITARSGSADEQGVCEFGKAE